MQERWRDVHKELPPFLDEPASYLVILESRARSQHAKCWAGMGKPEIAAYWPGWQGSGWSARGDLGVAYWMPLPEFNATWNPRAKGEEGRWELNNN